MQNFTPIGKAPAEKSVTVHNSFIKEFYDEDDDDDDDEWKTNKQ